MISLNDVYDNANAAGNGEDFENIVEDGMYEGRLAAQVISLQDDKYRETNEDGTLKPARELVSFVFDLINENGKSVKVRTKPCSFSFGDKANLPKIWNVTTPQELKSLLVHDGEFLNDVYVKCMVEVTHKDNGDFPMVKKVSKILEKSAQPATTLSDYDKKVYGKVPEAIYYTVEYGKLNK